MAMWTASNGASSHTPDMRRLLLIFSAWKLLLFIGAVFSPGPGYDTSTQLLLPSASESDLFPIRLLANVLPKFVRWDALYFVNSAHRGYLYEQEWAFHGSGFTTPVGGVAKGAHLDQVLHTQAKSFQCFLLSFLLSMQRQLLAY